MTDLLDAAARDAECAKLEGWTLSQGGDAITKRFVFADFSEAFGWMASVALAAERMDHHPEWTNVYRTVDVRLSTHDAGGLTALDFRLAAEMDRLAARQRAG
jgi:4a-hydroxytetrahydrobiopterin dehydratase